MQALAIIAGMGAGQVASVISSVQAGGRLAGQNLRSLAIISGMAAGWVASINGIQTGAASVRSALSSLAQRINSVPTPSVSAAAANGGGVKKYARGGIINHPHMGLVGEAGRESIIPWKKSPRSFSLWAQTGKALGFTEKANALSSSSGTTIHLTYAPTIQGASKQEIEPILRQDRDNLVDKLKAISHQKARVSFG
jgi:SLT domain-containing protein